MSALTTTEGNAVGRVRLVLDAPGRMVTMNWERGTSNRWAIAKVTDLWRRAASERAAELALPAFAWVEVDAWPYQARGVLADTAAHTPVVKAVLDGLRDAGVLSDDTGRQVHWIRMHPPKRGPNGVCVELSGPVVAAVAVPATPRTR